eukprot:UN28144
MGKKVSDTKYFAQFTQPKKKYHIALTMWFFLACCFWTIFCNRSGEKNSF